MSTPRSGGEQLKDLADQAGDAVQDVAEQAQDQVSQAASQAQGWVSEQINSRTTDVGEQITTVAQDARSFSELLDNHDKDVPAKVFRQLADRGERVGGYLVEADADRIRDDVESFARRQPWAVLAGTVTIGFVAARTMRAADLRRAQRVPPPAPTGAPDAQRVPPPAPTGAPDAPRVPPPAPTGAPDAPPDPVPGAPPGTRHHGIIEPPGGVAPAPPRSGTGRRATGTTGRL